MKNNEEKKETDRTFDLNKWPAKVIKSADGDMSKSIKLNVTGRVVSRIKAVAWHGL